MPSPFPGMDPYIEFCGLFPEFHHNFMTFWHSTIAELLPEPYEARIRESYNLIEATGDSELPWIGKRVEPDVAVLRQSEAEAETATASEPIAAATLTPEFIPISYVAPSVETWIEILERPHRELVTVLEILSPSNKDSRGRAVYLNKRQTILTQSLNLFELDLLLGGQPMPLQKPLRHGEYHALVYRAENRPLCDVYRWSIRDRLPVLPIPLKTGDEPIFVDFQGVYERAVASSRFGSAIDYSAAIEPTLDDGLAAWIRQEVASIM